MVDEQGERGDDAFRNLRLEVFGRVKIILKVMIASGVFSGRFCCADGMVWKC